jgi:hypothetical protein
MWLHFLMRTCVTVGAIVLPDGVFDTFKQQCLGAWFSLTETKPCYGLQMSVQWNCCMTRVIVRVQRNRCYNIFMLPFYGYLKFTTKFSVNIVVHRLKYNGVARFRV